MSSEFIKVENTELTLKLFLWRDHPAASVEVCGARDADAQTLAKVIGEAMAALLSQNKHRAFIFFTEECFDLVRNLLKLAKEIPSDYEVNLELIGDVARIAQYGYFKIGEILKDTNSEKFLILSVAPNRVTQARRLNVYEDKDELNSNDKRDN